MTEPFIYNLAMGFISLLKVCSGEIVLRELDVFEVEAI